MSKAKIVRVKLSDLILHPDLQMRAGAGMIDHDHVDDMVEALKKRAKLPRPKVRNVAGLGYCVTDGFHGVTARRIVNEGGTCECDVADGEWVDACEDAAGANHHKDAPKKRTADDKRRAVRRLVEEHKKAKRRWAVQRYADHCHVSDSLVKAVLKDMKDDEGEAAAEEPVFVERKDGTKQKAQVRKRTPEQKAATAPTGQVKEEKRYDWKAFDAAFGLVARMPDDINRVSGELRGTTECLGVWRLIEELAGAVVSFRRVYDKHFESKEKA